MTILVSLYRELKSMNRSTIVVMVVVCAVMLVALLISKGRSVEVVYVLAEMVVPMLAMIIPGGIVSRDIDAGTLELLLVRPIPASRLYARRYVLALVVSFLIGVVFLLSLWFSYGEFQLYEVFLSLFTSLIFLSSIVLLVSILFGDVTVGLIFAGAIWLIEQPMLLGRFMQEGIMNHLYLFNHVYGAPQDIFVSSKLTIIAVSALISLLALMLLNRNERLIRG